MWPCGSTQGYEPCRLCWHSPLVAVPGIEPGHAAYETAKGTISLRQPWYNPIMMRLPASFYCPFDWLQVMWFLVKEFTKGRINTIRAWTGSRTRTPKGSGV